MIHKNSLTRPFPSLSNNKFCKLILRMPQENMTTTQGLISIPIHNWSDIIDIAQHQHRMQKGYRINFGITASPRGTPPVQSTRPKNVLNSRSHLPNPPINHQDNADRWHTATIMPSSFMVRFHRTLFLSTISAGMKQKGDSSIDHPCLRLSARLSFGTSWKVKCHRQNSPTEAINLSMA